MWAQAPVFTSMVRISPVPPVIAGRVVSSRRRVVVLPRRRRRDRRLSTVPVLCLTGPDVFSVLFASSVAPSLDPVAQKDSVASQTVVKPESDSAPPVAFHPAFSITPPGVIPPDRRQAWDRRWPFWAVALAA